MSQLEKLVGLLNEFGLKPEMVDLDWPGESQFAVKAEENRTVVTIGCGNGYGGFLASFYFDAGGTFTSHGVYE